MLICSCCPLPLTWGRDGIVSGWSSQPQVTSWDWQGIAHRGWSQLLHPHWAQVHFIHPKKEQSNQLCKQLMSVSLLKELKNLKPDQLLFHFYAHILNRIVPCFIRPALFQNLLLLPKTKFAILSAQWQWGLGCFFKPPKFFLSQDLFSSVGLLL